MGIKLRSVRRMSDEELIRRHRATLHGGRDLQVRNRIYEAEMCRRGLTVTYYSNAGGGSSAKCLKGRNF